MKPFIESCVDRMVQNHSNPEDLFVVIPSKRAKKYLQEQFVRTYNKTIFLPEILTIEELVQQGETQPILDKTRQIFTLYEVAKTLPTFESLTFEAFLAWGPIVLNDFEEINRYLLDPVQVFKNLLSIKELESWNLETGKELSESQQQFMGFWDVLPTLYDQYVETLDQRGQTTPAQLIRKRAAQPESLMSDKTTYFIGFNALSKAEQRIIHAFLQAKKGEYWIDADEFYFHNSIHEAGLFLRKNNAFFGINKPKFLGDHLSSKPLDIQLIACPQTSGQVKVAATELAKLDSKDLDSTLVLLADERLIIPFLKNIPASVEQANITLGMPLNQTPLKSWVDLIFSFQENKERFKSQSAYYKDLLTFFQHPFITAWISLQSRDKITRWELETIQFNRVFQRKENLKFDSTIDPLIGMLMEDWNQKYDTAIRCIQGINQGLLDALGQSNEFESQILVVFQQGITAFMNLSKEGMPAMNLRTFKLFFNQHWSMLSLAYHGNPTQGLQIMGLLETRLLDFKQVIVLGMNEGALPANNGVDSMIPMDLRKGLGLPTPREKQGLFAHHFYRLLHRAEKCVITYSIGAEGMGTSEPSRYLAQLEMELCRRNPSIQVTHQVFTTPRPLNQEYRTSSIQKRPQMVHLLDNYFAKKVSSSAISKFLQCPLDFYFRYLAELGEEDSVVEDLDLGSTGKIIHSTLEELYFPFVERDKNNVPVTPAPSPLRVMDLEAMMNKAPAVLKAHFVAYLDNDEGLISSGKNYLTHTVALEFVMNSLRNDKAYVQSMQEEVYIHRLEAMLTASMEVQVAGNLRTIHWVGFVDRIDRVGNAYRLVDYKSGKVTQDHVTYAQKEDEQDAFRACKHALQLAVYTFLFEKNYGFRPTEVGIYAIQKNKEAFFNLVFKETNFDAFMEDFSEVIQRILSEMYDLDLPFEHSPSAKYCNYC